MAKADPTLKISDVVGALYRVLLQREPDHEGAQGKIDAIVAGQASLEDTIASITGSPEFVAAHPEPLPPTDRFTNDQTPFGELELLLRLWVNQSAAHGIVVDVGARGRQRSNAYDLMKTFGWRGYLFEANPDLIPVIKAEFAGLDLDLTACAVSDYTGEATFRPGADRDAITVPAERLGNLLRDRGVPEDFDLLSIGVASDSVNILNDACANFAYRPAWVIIEASRDLTTQSLDDLPFHDLVRRDYEVVAQTDANLILGLRGTSPDAPA